MLGGLSFKCHDCDFTTDDRLILDMHRTLEALK